MLLGGGVGGGGGWAAGRCGRGTSVDYEACRSE